MALTLRALPNQFTAYTAKAQHPVIPAQAGIQRILQASCDYPTGLATIRNTAVRQEDKP